MARLHEYQGKRILQRFDIPVPDGQVVTRVEDVQGAVASLGFPLVLKAQSWTTGRFSQGLIQFADSTEEAEEQAARLFQASVANTPVTEVLIERRLRIRAEYYAGIIINDALKRPELIFSSQGGTGIEDLVRCHPETVCRYPVTLSTGLSDFEARNIVCQSGLLNARQDAVARILVNLWNVMQACEARTVEINPLVLTEEGDLVAADCRLTIDDYAVFRHPEHGIEIAREFDHPPTPLEKIAYGVEADDYRGTFYFIQLEQHPQPGVRVIGFHGAGGGGSMISMDAIQKHGYTLANFTDTSGNPPASKVYRAAMIILSQQRLRGYFGSGSGVASQEQTNSARGLVKAFRESGLRIPAVIRLGGNLEDEAVRILETGTADLPAPVEGYKKDHPVDFCAERMEVLIRKTENTALPDTTVEYTTRALRTEAREPFDILTVTGRLLFDLSRCRTCVDQVCVPACEPQVLAIRSGVPVPALSKELIQKGKCTECLACELACWFQGNRGLYVELPIPGFEEYQSMSVIQGRESKHEHSD